MTGTRKPPSPSRRPDLATAAAILFLLFQALPAGGQGALEEVLCAVTLNDVQMSDGTILLRDGGGGYLVSEEDLGRWRLRAPAGMRREHRGTTYVDLGAIPGARAVFDGASQTLAITVPPGSFAKTTLGLGAEERAEPRGGAGIFFNYDLSLSGGEGERSRLDGLSEVGVFNRFGSGVGSFLWRDAAGGGDPIRLETVWTVDLPAERQTFRLGDSFTRGGAMGRPVRFGGLQWARNFATDPGFVTFPSPVIGGLAEKDSVVDVYVNNVRQTSNEVPRGPFEIFNVPVVTGKGEVSLVVKDLLGREHVVTEPYYVSSALLKRGLSDFSLDVGFEREEYALSSGDYGALLASGTMRYGISDRLTGEAHAEIKEDLGMMSVSGVWLNRALGVFSFGFAESRDQERWGSQGTLGYEFAARRLSLGLGGKLATRHFSQLGVEDRLPLEHEARARFGFRLGRFGSVGLSYTQQREYDQERSSIVTGSYNVNLWKGQLNLTALRTCDGGESYGFTATYVVPLGERRTILANGGQQSHSWSGGLELQRGLPSSGLGYGYSLRADKTGETESLRGSLTRQGEWSRLRLDLSRQGGDGFYRAGLSGSAGVLDGHFFASRWLSQSFVLARVAEFENVRVYSNGQEVGRTDREGRVFVPDLLPYWKNRLRIEESDLPIDCRIDATETTAVPGYRSGMSVAFPVRSLRGALATLVTPDGSPLPAGSVVKSPDREGEWFVGLRGEVYLTDLAKGANVLEVQVGERRCRLVLAVPADLAGVPNLGKQVCGFEEH